VPPTAPDAATPSPASPPPPLLPPGFVLGVGTAAYAVEGAATADGRGESCWDVFDRAPGVIEDGTTGAVAADGYHRWAEDVDLLRGLGVGGYRFSLSWSRLLPTGRGAPLAAGLDHYDRLIDRLLEVGVEPMVVLHHWDLPQALQLEGGWLNPDTARALAELAAVAGERYADRVAHWVPVDQPTVLTTRGYAAGMHAPGYRFGMGAMPALHHLNLGHGLAVLALRAAGARSVGCAANHAPMWPASEDAADVGAAKLFDALWNGTQLEPMLLGRYPADVEPLLADVVGPGDLATIRQPLDFYGVSYDAPLRVSAAPATSASSDGPADPFQVRAVVGHDVTEDGVPIVPEGLREWLIQLRARFRAALPPVVVTAVTCAQGAGPDRGGVVDDQARIDHLRAHLEAVAEAAQRGVDVRGFYAWSLLDGFSWNRGWARRTGLVHVDPGTLVRTPKRSYDWYAEVAAAQTASLG